MALYNDQPVGIAALDALSGLFVQVLALCQQSGLVKLGHVALDGTKVKANASKHKAYRDTEDQGLGEVVQVWVASAHRGGRVAGALLDSLVSWARDSGFECLSAWVNDENRRAARFFGKHGFEMTSETEPFRPGFDQAARLMTRIV